MVSNHKSYSPGSREYEQNVWGIQLEEMLWNQLCSSLILHVWDPVRKRHIASSTKLSQIPQNTKPKGQTYAIPAPWLFFLKEPMSFSQLIDVMSYSGRNDCIF